MIKPIQRYEDHLWYPIVIRMNGGSVIREMQGIELNTLCLRTNDETLSN